MSWKPKFMLLARAVCILVLVPEWSDVVSAMIRPNTRDHFGSLESYISKTIRPTWATSCLLLTSLRGCCVALSSVTTVHHFRLFWFFLMPRVSCTLVFMFFWNQGWWLWTSEAHNPIGCVIQHIAFHATETRNQGLLNANCRWLCVALDMDDLFLGVDSTARWALCHTCANSESTLASTAVSYSYSRFTCDWEHSRPSRESRSTIYHKFSGFPNERSRTSSALLR